MSYKIKNGKLEKRGAQQKARTADDAAPRSWATGTIKVVANDRDCFTWSGTKQDAIDLQRRFLDAANTFGANCQSFAKRAAGYLILHSMPQAGDRDYRPSSFGRPWDQNGIEVYRAAVLWLALREHIPDTGQKLEDVFVGKSLVMMLDGDKEGIIEDTMRELRGEPFSGDEFTMMVGVLDEKYRLDPRDAVSVSGRDLLAITGKLSPEDPFANKPVFVPRVPVDAGEADAMLAMVTLVTDATDPSAADPREAIRWYAGYTDEELARGKPCLRIR